MNEPTVESIERQIDELFAALESIINRLDKLAKDSQ